MVPMACVCDGPSAKGAELPDGSDGFRDLLEAFVFGTLQELRNVQENDEAAVELAEAGNVTAWRCFSIQRLSRPSGTREVGVLAIFLALFFRATRPAGMLSTALALLAGAIENKAVHGIEQIAGKLQHLFGSGGKLGGAGSRLLH